MTRSINFPLFATCVLFCIVVANAMDITQPCEEGKEWKDKCRTCHCTNGKAVCTRELCEGEGPTPLAGAEGKTTCKPGEKWMEDCNNCICDNDGEPECSRRICGRPSKAKP